jgi:hypothetical protein
MGASTGRDLLENISPSIGQVQERDVTASKKTTEDKYLHRLFADPPVVIFEFEAVTPYPLLRSRTWSVEGGR